MGANAAYHVSGRADLDKTELWEGGVTRPQVKGAKSCPGRRHSMCIGPGAGAEETEGGLVKLGPIDIRTTVGVDTVVGKPGKICRTFLAILESSTFVLKPKEGS